MMRKKILILGAGVGYISYFMDKVLADKNFPQYHGKYPTAKENIPRNTYIGASVYVAPAPKEENTEGESAGEGGGETPAPASAPAAEN